MHMKKLEITLIVVIFAADFLFHECAEAQFEVGGSVLGTGGTALAGASSRITGTVGQPAIGPAGSLSETMSSGFWYAAKRITFGNVPTVTTDTASNISTTSATLNGTVNPNSLSTTVKFEYGTTTNYGSEVTAIESPVSGMSPVSVSAQLTGLSPNTTYHYRVVGTNSVGTTNGTNQSFTTLSTGSAPTVTTDAASNVSTTSATLNGTINPNGLSTTVTFEWGETTSYGNTMLASPSLVTETSPVSVSAQLSGLSPNTTYHYRVVGTNSAGTTNGVDQMFTTVLAGTAPTVTTDTATSVSTTSATLNGTVNPNGLSTTVVFQYGTTTSYGSQVTATESPVTGTSAVSVSAQLTGLSPDTTYHYQVVGTNSAGTTNGTNQSFTTLSAGTAPTVTTDAASNVSTTSATLNGMVNPNGLSTTVVFQYGTTTSYGSQVTAVESPVSGTSPVSVSGQLSDLSPNTVFHYRVVGTNSAGTTNGANQMFTTTALPSAVALTSGNNQTGTISTALSDPFVVTVTDGGGNPVQGVDVTFAIASVPTGATGQGLSVSGTTTDVNGQASTVLTLGDKVGAYTVTASSAGLTGSPVTFNATATAPPPPPTVDVNTTVSFPSRPDASDYGATDYRIVGLPGASNRPVNEFLSGTQDTDWQVYWDNGAASDFLLEFDGGSNFLFSVGRGFWLVNKGPWNVSSTVAFAELDTSQAVNIPVHTGWNLITNPFDSPITWSKIQVVNGISEPIHSFSGSFGTSINFDPYVGYYFFNASNLSSLQIPYDSIFTGSLTFGGVSLASWSVNIVLTSGDFVDRAARLGVSKEANTALDHLDLRKPRTVSPVPTVYFHRPDWDRDYSSFATDMRPEFEEEESWEFEVRAAQGEPSQLAFSGVEDVPREFEVYLIDEGKASFTNLRDDSLYSFTPVAYISKFSVVVAQKDALRDRLDSILPKEFSLGHNYPNPFNPSTTIPVVIPISSKVKLAIYDILGEEVRVLYVGTLEAGRHWFTWDGRGDSAENVSSGIYFSRLSTSNGLSFVRKMVIIK